MDNSFRKAIDEKSIRLSLLRKYRDKLQTDMDELTDEISVLHETREIFKKASILTQNHLASHLSSIVTKSLRVVWNDKNISFHTEFVERRNTTECDMWIEENGHKYSLLGSKGYGVIDVISFSLKVAYILLHRSDNICIIDEPFRNVSKNKHEILSKLIKELSEELDMQFIMATHSQSLIEHADVAFEIINGESNEKNLQN